MVINEIMRSNRHKFVYCDSGEDRDKILKDMNGRYPAFVNSQNPILVKIVDKGLPESVDEIDATISLSSVLTFHRGYYEMLIALNVIDTLIPQVDQEVLNQVFGKKYERYNRYVSDGFVIKNIIDFRNVLYKSMIGYYNQYLSYIKTGIYNLVDIPLSTVLLSYLIRDIKELLGIKSYFGIVFVCQDELSLMSQKAINYYIAQRSNADMSINVLCLEDEWKTHYDLNGNFIEYTHDYTTMRVGNKNAKDDVGKVRRYSRQSL